MQATIEPIHVIAAVADNTSLQSSVFWSERGIQGAHASRQNDQRVVMAKEIQRVAALYGEAAKSIQVFLEPRIGNDAAGSDEIRQSMSPVEELLSCLQSTKDVMAKIAQINGHEG